MFKVIDLKTGTWADPESIAVSEEWANGLIYCDMEGFARLEDGSLILVDECGSFKYCPQDRFQVVEAVEHGVHPTGLNDAQKEEVRKMIQSALDTGSA